MKRKPGRPKKRPRSDLGGILEVDAKKEGIEYTDERDKQPQEEEDAKKSSSVLSLQSELVKRVNVQAIKMSPKNTVMARNSPVKIINEAPLVIAPAPEKEEVSGVVKELNFGGGDNEEEDDELIPSSQSQEQVQRIAISLTEL